MVAMLRVICVVLVAGLAVGRAPAAEITRVGPVQTDPGLGCSYRMSGQILPGDADRLEAVITAEMSQRTSVLGLENQIVLCLEGPGGSFLDALAIAEFVFSNDITTRIDPNATRLSACAIAFLGGNYNTYSGEGWRVSRFVHPTSRLGFHAPDLVLPEGQFSREDVGRAYDIAIEAVGLITAQAERLRIPQPLLTQMFNHRGDDFHMVETIDHLATYGILLYGHSPPQLTAETRRYACLNAWRWQLPDAPSDTLDAFVSYTQNAASFADEPGGVVRFSPFDGYLYCRVEATALGGGTMDLIQASEWQNFQNIRVETVRPQWIRYPGPLPLTRMFLGSNRDF